MMKIRIMGLLLPVLLLAAVITEVEAGSRQTREIEDAIEIIQEFTKIPENRIPPYLLRNAQAIAVIPGVIKIGFIFAGNYGKGVLSVRDKYGYWTNPAFITLAGGSIGWQIGAQSSDIILVFKTMKSINDITAGKFTLGADASVAVGPVGRQAGAGTDFELKSEIYSYSRTRGLFAGVSVQGAALEMDYDSIADFYDNTQIGARDIFETPDLKAPQVAADFRLVLGEQTRR
ncbi:MAG: lipid-binding SYLF domain-containing protein [Deltaproteobacteria bacterium]|nr:lipid-binding SYLF domain-containing protein [Deltaproteobacteria bacterium]